ncbi:unnamed protein product [Didymodactylos carnosus]|uniref:Uncharacterized protein n=1 Tax=Didymodactylos carnosus TaxID=1234261 RepID=A0A814PXA7_9BILA|nr:unnamed protein product [Didymodactylos carnosus]CAF1257105.1 unnamed protein product [Didymodactylos carnosus]CAF3876102.1 unnamed protein product [Didymodactylos carnosus]CAF4064010.1 unnamed protein product [Didymodactylos carnosus]
MLPRFLQCLTLLVVIVKISHEQTPSQLTLVEQRLLRTSQQISLQIFADLPDPETYINFYLTANFPHKINVTGDITSIIREWKPELLKLDPTGPYYFSNVTNASLPHEHYNLLYYLNATETNTTLVRPFVNVMPQSYRYGLHLLSIFNCQEYLAKSNFESIDLIIGPGPLAELPLGKMSDYGRLYCSLHGWPHFLMIDQTKNPNVEYNEDTLLSEHDLSSVEFGRTTVAPGTCLFIPSDWMTGIRLNNSISFVITLKTISSNNESLTCTPTTTNLTLNNVNFTVKDSFNISKIALLVYFYQYLQAPFLEKRYTVDEFYSHARNDKNLTKLVLQWTPELEKLIEHDLFKELDINNDSYFDIKDYYAIKQPMLDDIHRNINEILEKLRLNVVEQYKELNASLSKVREQMSSQNVMEDIMKINMEQLIEKLPQDVKDKLLEQNIDIKQFLNSLLNKQNDDTTIAGRRKRRKENEGKQRHLVDESTILFDDTEFDIDNVDLDEEEEITAEPDIIDEQINVTLHKEKTEL